MTARLADLRGDCVAEASQPLAHVSVPVDERLDAVRRTTDGVLASAAVDPGHVLAVAVGVLTPVDAEGLPVGREAYLPGLPGRDLRPEIGGRYGWPVLLENDANLAAWGERWRGVAAGVDDLVVMVADERLGSGLFLGGRPVRGHAGGAEPASSSWSSGSAAPTASPTWSDPRRRGRCRPGRGGAGGRPRPAAVDPGRRGPDQVRRRPSWRPPGPATRPASGSSTAWPSGWRSPSPPWPGCSTPSWWSSPGPWPTTATCSWTGSGGGCCRPHRRPAPGGDVDLGDQAVVLGAVRMALDHVEASLLGSSGASPARDPGPGRGPTPGADSRPHMTPRRPWPILCTAVAPSPGGMP